MCLSILSNVPRLLLCGVRGVPMFARMKLHVTQRTGVARLCVLNSFNDGGLWQRARLAILVIRITSLLVLVCFMRFLDNNKNVKYHQTCPLNQHLTLCPSSIILFGT